MTRDTSEKDRCFPYTTPPPHRPPHYHHLPCPHQRGVFVTHDDPTVTNHNLLKSSVYIMTHSWQNPGNIPVAPLAQRRPQGSLRHTHLPNRDLHCLDLPTPRRLGPGNFLYTCSLPARLSNRLPFSTLFPLIWSPLNAPSSWMLQLSHWKLLWLMSVSSGLTGNSTFNPVKSPFRVVKR